MIWEERLVSEPGEPERREMVVSLRKPKPVHSRRGSEVTDCAEWGGEGYSGLYGERELTILGVSGGTLKATRGRGCVSYRGSD